jgi:hypothetical protein
MSKPNDSPFRHRLLSGFAAAALVAGCATTPEPPPPAPAAGPPPQATPARATQPPPRTASAPVPLNPRHPERYVVKRGDTLWDISAMFLRDPWFWPEIWYANPQVQNPHLIYPGDVLTLVYVDGQPRIVLERGEVAGTAAERLQPRVRAEPLEEAIFTIPYDRIAAFLSRPSVLDRQTIDRAPYVLGDRRGHLVHGAHTEVYVRGGDFAADEVFSVMHIGSELRDPDNGRLLGFHGIYAGEGRIVRGGDPGTMYLNSTEREVLNGDRLLPVRTDFPLRFVPRAPEQAVEGTIIDALNTISRVGSYQIVVLNRGARHGLEPGHVLSVWQAGNRVPDRIGGGRVQLPDEYAGYLMVFQTYDEVSFGLIMQAANEIRLLDRVRNP